MAPGQLRADYNVNTLFEEINGNFLNYKSNQKNIYLKQNMTNERVDDSKGAEFVSVDVMELSRRRDVKLEAKEDPDATENSSSFADTDSGNENGLSDAEAESQFFGENDLAPSFDGFGSVFPMRKKKLTTHWRNYIHPLMWRCKWTELKIKELESQASKYARYLAIYERNKHTASDQVTSGSRSIPFSFKGHRKRPMKRLKRKKVEDTTDIALYMSKHNLFCERENKRPDFDAVSTWDDLGNSDQQTNGHDEFGTHDDSLFLEENDNLLETILRKIELVHTRVHKLKTQLNSVTINNTSKFSSSENLSQNGVGDVPTSFVHSPTFSACNGDTISIGGGLYDLGDFSSFGEAITIPDIIESTVGLLSSIDVTEHQTFIGDSSEKILDNIVINNETGEVEESTFKNDHNQSGEKSQEEANSGEEEEEMNNNGINLALESEKVAKAVVVSEEHSTLRSSLASEIHFPKNKRKRGERKAGSSNWSKHK
ncbi:hypothetical protein ACJIZ3_009836 [Penstemon smallii]|uniref:Uncharacterized protein n=1 Tax=Penstemon smallii TaxID=265156 RepID=A0ABD3TDM4_9LAMI